MASPTLFKRPDGTLLVERFTPIRRVEHVFGIIVFVLLVLTGFPQRYPDTTWAQALLGLFGGLESTRDTHRVVGYIFAGHAVVHLTAIMVGVLTRKMRLSLLPTTRDFRDAWMTLRYYLGFRRNKPPLPKFDYRQKFEYIGLVLGGLVMIVTGFILMFPNAFATLFPGQLIPAAQVAHSNEAILALLVLVVWHIYSAVFSPEVFPLDTCIFTGYLTAEELEERHEDEFKRLFPNGVPNGSHSPSEGEPTGVAESSPDSETSTESQNVTDPPNPSHDPEA